MKDRYNYQKNGARRWLVAALVLATIAAGCAVEGSGTSTSSSVVGSDTSTSTSSTVTTTSTTSTTTSLVPASTVPGALLPDQGALPVMLFVNGVVYDLAEVPAPELIDIGQSSLPYAGPPVLTEGAWLVATGASYDATLTLYPTGGGDPVELARGVGSFALSPDGQRLAWAEPTPTERDGDTELIEVAFPSGQVLHTTTFSGFSFPDVDPPVGFADVVTYVGDNVLLMTGDGAVSTAAVWTPATGEVTIAPGYGSGLAGNANGNGVVLSQGDGICGVIASIGDDGSVSPPDGGFVSRTLDCSASWAPTFSPDGAVIASAGTQGDTGPPIVLLTSTEGPELARLPINDVAGQYFQPHTIRWLDNETLLLLASSFDSSRTEYWDEEWGIWRCHTLQSDCDLAQAIAFSPTDFNQVALVDTTKVDTIERALGRLPDRQRTALLLCDRAGLGYGEVAEVLGCTPAAAKVLIHRARVSFRAYYTENGA
jgi:hypothetical protein